MTRVRVRVRVSVSVRALVSVFWESAATSESLRAFSLYCSISTSDLFSESNSGNARTKTLVT